MTHPERNDRVISGPQRDYVGYGRDAPDITWPDGARVALNIVVNYEEGSEQMKPLGDTENEGMVDLPKGMPDSQRDLAVESLYEYGSRTGIWRLQRLLDRLEVPVTVFACALAIERNPEVGAWIKEAQHDVCGHGWRWEKPWKLTREQERQRIDWAIQSLTKTCGTSPVGWYCRYGPSVNTRELLVEQGGFLYDSDAYNDDLPYYSNVKGQPHLVVPYSQLINDGKFVRSQGYSSPDDFLQYAKRNLDFLIAEGAERPSMMSIGLHPRLMGHPARASVMCDFLEYAQQCDSVWIARRQDIAQFWMDNCSPLKIR
jgi:allantoinase